MWRGFSAALVAYGVAVCAEWTRRGRADAVRATLLEFTGGAAPDVDALRPAGALPPWLGFEPLHVSHRSSLVRKDPAHYRRYFPDVPDDLPYVWPPSVFPRWPVRRGDAALELDEALAELGWTEPGPGQRDAVAELVAGHDVTLDWAPGSGATSTGLLAALCLPGRSLWVSAHAGAGDVPPLHELQRAVSGPQPASRTSASIARPPTAVDLAAMADEHTRAREFLFHSATALRSRRLRRDLQDVSLMVLDGVERVARVGRAAVLSIRPGAVSP